MQFVACPSFFLLSPLSTCNLYSLHAPGRAKAVKNYSLHFQFSTFVIAFYFPVCWALFSKATCCEESLSRPCYLKIWELLFPAECPLSTCHASPTLADLGLWIWGPPRPHSHLCRCSSTLLVERWILRHKCIMQSKDLASWTTTDASMENCKLAMLLSHPVVDLVTVVFGGVVKLSRGERADGECRIKK